MFVLLLLTITIVMIECYTNSTTDSDVHRRLEFKIINGVKYLVKKMRRPKHDSSSSSSSSTSSSSSSSSSTSTSSDSTSSDSNSISSSTKPDTSHHNDSAASTSSESSKKKSRTVSYRFKNSRLGTTEYNKVFIRILVYKLSSLSFYSFRKLKS